VRKSQKFEGGADNSDICGGVRRPGILPGARFCSDVSTRRNTVKKSAGVLFAILVIATISSTAFAHPQGSAAAPIKVIFDTDFLVPPQDDGLALALALKSPELQVLGITTVAGNGEMQQETADALRELEILGRTDIPVYMGAERPLVHQGTEWAQTVHGKWWSDAPPVAPPGGFAKAQAQKESAVDFIIRTVNANPGQITIIAIGPLTNVAIAIRQSPGFAQKVKQINIMGGAIGSLDGGGGNVTPNAEFNFWVDPESAQVVVRSGIPIKLTGLNVTRKTDFTKDWYDKIVAADTPLARFLKERMDRGYAANPNRRGGQMYDELTVASLIDPTLVTSKDMYVDVDINHGPDYGVSVGALKIWEGGEGARQISVQYDVDNDRFMKMYAERLARK
jgi:inosine-uridine nucleoside N-ribohydrolase